MGWGAVAGRAGGVLRGGGGGARLGWGTGELLLLELGSLCKGEGLAGSSGGREDGTAGRGSDGPFSTSSWSLSIFTRRKWANFLLL